MKNKYLYSLLLLIAFAYSCKKAPTNDELQGTWYEQSDNAVKTKLIFQSNDLLIYFHDPAIDTLTYSLDRKHFTLYLNLYHNSNNVSPTGYETEYHKRKKILTITGLLPATLGHPTVAEYKQ